MSESTTASQAQALGEAALDAINAGLAAGRVGAIEPATALLTPLGRGSDGGEGAKALARELLDVAAGRSTITAPRGDNRFADAAWRENPVYRRIGQAYLATAHAINDAIDAADLDWRRAA